MARKLVAGLGLTAAWLLFAASQVVFPGPAGDGPAGMLASLREDVDPAVRGAVLVYLSAILFVPALVATATLVRGRGGSLALAATSVFVLGAMGHAMVTFRTLVLVAMAAPEAAPDQMAALMERLGTANFLAIVPLMYADTLGPLLLAGALWRARLAPGWPLALFAVAGLLFFAVTPGANVGLRILVQIPAIAAIVWMALALLRTPARTDDDARGTVPAPSRQLGAAA